MFTQLRISESYLNCYSSSHESVSSIIQSQSIIPILIINLIHTYSFLTYHLILTNLHIYLHSMIRILKVNQLLLKLTILIHYHFMFVLQFLQFTIITNCIHGMKLWTGCLVVIIWRLLFRLSGKIGKILIYRTLIQFLI